VVKALWHFAHTDLLSSAMRLQKSQSRIFLSLALLNLRAESKRLLAVIAPTGNGVLAHKIWEHVSSSAFGIAALIISCVVIVLKPHLTSPSTGSLRSG